VVAGQVAHRRWNPHGSHVTFGLATEVTEERQSPPMIFLCDLCDLCG
jgi:hypothetical protein